MNLSETSLNTSPEYAENCSCTNLNEQTEKALTSKLTNSTNQITINKPPDKNKYSKNVTAASANYNKKVITKETASKKNSLNKMNHNVFNKYLSKLWGNKKNIINTKNKINNVNNITNNGNNNIKNENTNNINDINPINDTPIPNYSNWIKGETLNPQTKPEFLKKDHFVTLEPPIVKLTRKAVEEGDSIYVLSRLRDFRIYNNVRLFLSYFYDHTDICYAGITQTNLKVLINQDGLPTNYKELCQIYFTYHERIGISKEDVNKDLTSYRRHIDNNYRDYIQKVRESWNKYMTPISK